MKNSKQTVGNDLCTPIKKDVPAPGLQVHQNKASIHRLSFCHINKFIELL